MHRRILAIAWVVAVAVSAGATSDDPSAARWWSHVVMLADDYQSTIEFSRGLSDAGAIGVVTILSPRAGAFARAAHAAYYNAIIVALLQAIGNDPARPQWRADSVFRRFAASSE